MSFPCISMIISSFSFLVCFSLPPIQRQDPSAPGYTPVCAPHSQPPPQTGSFQPHEVCPSSPCRPLGAARTEHTARAPLPGTAGPFVGTWRESWRVIFVLNY